MPARIDTLTDAQRARMAPWAQEWIARGLCTDEADWDAWERGARACYGYAGIPWPGRVVRVGSPLMLALAAPRAAALWRSGSVRETVDVSVRETVNDVVNNVVLMAVREAVNEAVRDVVRNAVDGAVGGEVRGAVDGAVGGEVRGAVCGEVRGAVDGAVGGEVGEAVCGDVAGAEWYRYLGGTFWLSWQAYEGFFRHVCGLTLFGDLSDRADAYALAQQSAGWWWPHRKFVMVADRPAEIHRERVGSDGWGSHRLHNPTGPALRYRDGWSLYRWHGVDVPRAWIEARDTVTAADVLGVRNVEQRRAGCEILGWNRILAELPHRVIDADRDPQIGTLLHVDLPDAPGSAFLRVRCGTGREFAIPVPREMRSAREANARTYRLAPEAYNPEKRT